MTFGEGNGLSGVIPAPAGDFGFVSELAWPSLDGCALTAGNCDEACCRLPCAAPDNCTSWTNEKHSLYLNHLELSFVKQFQQSMSLLLHKSSEPLDIDNDISPKLATNIHLAPEKLQILRSQTNNDETFESLLHTSTDFQYAYTSKNHRKIRKQCQSSSAGTHGLLKPHHTNKHTDREVMISGGLPRCTQLFSASNLYNDDSFNLLKEGTGQNFVSEGISYISNNCHVKRLKTSAGYSSAHDKIHRADKSSI